MYRLKKIHSSCPLFNFSAKQCGMLLKGYISSYNTSSGLVSIDENVELYYEQCGNTSDHTILCIPGALGSARSDFSYQLDNLSKDFNMIAYDPRGYGKSQKTKRKFPLNYFHQDASDAAELMKMLGHKKYSVLGWSDGGIAGKILAAEQSDSIENLIIWGGASYVRGEDKALLEKTRDTNKWSDKMRVSLESIYGKEGLKRLWSDFLDGYSAFADNPDGSICIPELKKILCPTLIMHGAQDALVPSFHPQFLHEHIKNSRLIVMPNGKHNLHMRYYEEFNKLVRDFIKKN